MALLPPCTKVIFEKMPPRGRRTQRVGRPTFSSETLAGNSKMVRIEVPADSGSIGINAINRPDGLQ